MVFQAACKGAHYQRLKTTTFFLINKCLELMLVKKYLVV